MVEFCDFGTVSFVRISNNVKASENTDFIQTGASAKTSSTTYGPGSGGIIDIKQNGKVLTSVSTSSSGVEIKYV